MANNSDYVDIGWRLRNHKHPSKKNSKFVKRTISYLINDLILSTKERLDIIIKMCLLCEIDCMILIEAYDSDDSEKAKICSAVLFGWTKAHAK